MSASHLADTSAWIRSGRTAALRERWSALLDESDLATCSPVRLELLYSARSPVEYAALADDLGGLPALPLDRAAVARAEEVQGLLAGTSQHRAATVVGLYIAAVAEVNAVTLIHYDRHFDAIAAITGQPAEWLAPRGTLD